MITKEQLIEYKDALEGFVDDIENQDIELLVEWLEEKDDKLRYSAFLLLQMLSGKDGRVYRHWDTFVEKFNHENSYQRSLGLMLICENVKWDIDNRFGKVYREYLAHCDDEKFITARQCIQGLIKVIPYNKQYRNEIIETLIGIDLEKRKDSQKGLLLLDIVGVLGNLYKSH